MTNGSSRNACARSAICDANVGHSPSVEQEVRVHAISSPQALARERILWPRHRAALRELALWLLLWPVWWVMGVEQFVPSVALPLLAVRLALAGQLVLSRHRVLLSVFGLFLIVQLLSGLSIVDARRLLTFARSFSSWIAAFAVLTLAAVIPRDLDDVKKLVWMLAGLVAIASIVSVAALLGFRPQNWTSLVEHLLPASLDRGGYLDQLLERTFGRDAFFRPFGDYYRVSSLFLWPLQNASAMVVALPLVGALTQVDKAWQRAVAWGVVLLGMVNLAFTTGRAAIAGLLAGMLVVLAFYSRFRRLFWRVAAVVLVLLVVAVIIDLATSGGSFFLEGGASTLAAITFARDPWTGKGSSQARAAVVVETLRGWSQRPLLGWGTARAIPGLALPAGTHSAYLGILYKHGALGLAAFLLLLAGVWLGTRPEHSRESSGRDSWLHRLLISGRWSLVAVLVDSLTSNVAVDTMALTMTWFGFGALLAARRLLDEHWAQKSDRQGNAWILGVRVVSLSAAELTSRVMQLARERKHALVLNVNAHCLNLAYTRPWLRDMLNQAELVFCDGTGVVLAARLLEQRIDERITYAEWMWDLAAAASEAGVSMAFVGAAPGVAADAAQRLRQRYPKLRVEALHHGYFDKAKESAENAKVIEMINAMQPGILIVGFGMPLQEQWLAANWSRIEAGVALTGGGVFDYVSGARRRAPAWMTDHALEWLGRLIIEPRRLWRRYLIGNPLFVWRVLKQRMGIDRWPVPPSA